jgi:SprT protein
MVINGLRTCPPPAAPLHGAITARLEEGLVVVHDQRGFADFPEPSLLFFERRTAAGLALYDRWAIALNRGLFEAHPQENLQETVLHELAHLVVEYGRRTRLIAGRPAPHGPAWHRVMTHWFRVEPRSTHRQDTEHLNVRRQRRWPYRCGCRTWHITTIRHNRIQQQGLRYRCGSCSGPLCFVDGE